MINKKYGEIEKFDEDYNFEGNEFVYMPNLEDKLEHLLKVKLISNHLYLQEFTNVMNVTRR